MSAPALLEIVAKASLVWLVALAVTGMMSRSSAAARHLVWTVAIAATVLLPALVLFGPTWRVGLVPGGWAVRARSALRFTPAGNGPVAQDDVWPPRSSPASHAPVVSEPRQGARPSDDRVMLGAARRWSRMSIWDAVVWIWAVGALVAGLRLISGLVSASRLVRRATPLTAPYWLSAMHTAIRSIGLTRRVRLRMSDRVGVPVACGILRPALLLPIEADAWNDERRMIVLLHELAHVKRSDCLVQVIAQVARALHWFNPLAFVALSRLHAEQERACDDLVLKAGAPALDYANHLCEIVTASRQTAIPVWATLAFAAPSRLRARLVAILDDSRSRRPRTRALCAGIGALGCLFVVPLGALRPSATIEAAALLPSAALDRLAPYASLIEPRRPTPIYLSSKAALANDTERVGTARNESPTRAHLDVEAGRELLDTYCTKCHNDRLKTAGLTLDPMSPASVGDHVEAWEKVVRKLRSGLHPPRGLPRPDRTSADALSAGVEAAIDQFDRANWVPTVAVPLTDLELASRVSKFLWSSGPDEQLLKAGARGRLHDRSVTLQQVRRMLADGRSSAILTRFFGQWLAIEHLAEVKPDETAFPTFDENLRESFRREMDLFLASQVREDRSVVELLTASYSFVNDRLAEHYQIAPVKGSEFRRVTLTDDARFGLLGKASVLAVTSYRNRTSPVLRGKWVLEILLGAPPPPPPPNVPALKEAKSDPLPSIRQRLEEHRKNPVCASCHAMMDPFGFALENFDPIGRWRNFDGSAPIDASGELPDGVEVYGPAELRQALVDRREVFVSTVTLKLLAYALGRPARHSDMPAVREIVREAASANYRWSAILSAIVESRPFQTKRPTS